MILQYRLNTWLPVCETIRHDQGKNYWRIVKKLTKYNQARNTSAFIKLNAEALTSTTRKVHAFADHFTKIYSKANDPNFNDEDLRKITNWYEEFSDRPHIQNQIIEPVAKRKLACTQIL